MYVSPWCSSLRSIRPSSAGRGPTCCGGIDRWVGSIDVGKHADLVVWSAPPLSSYAVVEKVFVDGEQYFDRETMLRDADEALREAERLRAEESKKARPARGATPGGAR